MTLNVPAGMWGKAQFTSEEVAGNRKTASARIHVERFRYRLYEKLWNIVKEGPKPAAAPSQRYSIRLLPLDKPFARNHPGTGRPV